MSLELQYRWEHALVAATIKTASEKCPSCPLKISDVQKLIYFLKMLNVPMDYQFNIRRREPNCDEISFDVEWLMAEDIIEKNQTSNFVSSTNFELLHEKYSTSFSDYYSRIESVCDTFSEMIPKHLVLMAGLDYSYRWVKASGGNGPWEPKTLEKFKSTDNGKSFSDQEINHWYKKLVEADLVLS